MIRKSSKLILLLVTILVSGLFSGCSNSEQAVFDGMMKNSDILSYEDVTNLSLELKVTGATDEQMASITPFINIINGASLTVTQKVISNKEKTDIDGQFNFLVDTDGLSMHTDVWLDSGLKNGKYRFKEIIKMPSVMSAPTIGKEYMVIDSNYLKASDEIDFTKLMQNSLTFRNDLKESLAAFSKDYSFSRSNIEYVGTETLNGQSVQKYQMTFNDQTFKEWIHYIVDLSIEKGYLSDIAASYFSLMEDIAPTGENEILLSEISDIKDQIEILTPEGKTELLGEIDKFFTDTKDIPIIGEKGFVVNFSINKEGFIVASDGSLNMMIDVKKWGEKYPSEDVVEGNPVITLNLKFKENITNINNTSLAVEIPKIDYTNSMDIADFGYYEKPVKVYLDGERVYFEADPVIEDGTTMVPLKKLAEEMGMNVVWDGAAKTITVKKEGTAIVFRINSDKAYVNGIQMTMDKPAKIIDNSAMIPVSFIRQCFNADVTWDAASKSIFINTTK